MFYDIRKLYRVKHLWHFCALFACSLASFQVGAVVIPDRVSGAFDRMLAREAAAGILQLTYGGTSGAPVASGATASIVTDGGLPLVTRTGSVVNPSGNPIAITAASRVPGAAASVLIKKALPLIPILGTGVALYDLANELGYGLSGSGVDLGVSKISNIAPLCGNPPANTFPSTTSGCYGNYAGGLHFIVTRISYYSGSCNVYATCSNGAYVDTLIKSYSATGVTDPSTPSSLQALTDAIAAKSGWPSSSKVTQALIDAQATTGDQIETQTPTVTGPASTPGTTKTTSNPDGTTTTQTTTHNHTYQGSNISTSSVTVTNNYNPATNVTNTTTTTETPAPKEDQLTDCDKFPESNGCREDEFDTPEGEIPKEDFNVSFTELNLGLGSGSCPSDSVVTIGGQSMKVWDWADTCSKVQSYVKPLLLSIATVSALLIIFVGVKTE